MPPSSSCSRGSRLPDSTGPAWYFVFDGKSITGIVTPWDIGRQRRGGRTCTSGLPPSRWVWRTSYGQVVRDQELLLRLSRRPGDGGYVVARHEALRALDDEDADLVAAFDFQDTFEMRRPHRVPGASPRAGDRDGARSRFGYRATDIRNAVMHASRLDIAPNRNPTLALAGATRASSAGSATPSPDCHDVSAWEATPGGGREPRPTIDDLVGLTPERLAQQLPDAVLRRSGTSFRTHHPRPAARSGTGWGPLTQALVTSVLSDFGPGVRWRLGQGLERCPADSASLNGPGTRAPAPVPELEVPGHGATTDLDGHRLASLDERGSVQVLCQAPSNHPSRTTAYGNDQVDGLGQLGARDAQEPAPIGGTKPSGLRANHSTVRASGPR
ncbi:MAG: hypothetical protein R3C32_07515 [Chloroflexota bacterium]